MVVFFSFVGPMALASRCQRRMRTGHVNGDTRGWRGLVQHDPQPQLGRLELVSPSLKKLSVALCMFLGQPPQLKSGDSTIRSFSESLARLRVAEVW